MTGTSDVQIVFIEKAFVMKIILLIQILAGVEFLRHAQLAQIKNVWKFFSSDTNWLSQK